MSKIFLKDLFQFDELLKKHPSKRIKLRFNTNWKDTINNFNYDFLNMLTTNSKDFEPYILSIGSIKKARNDIQDIQFQFVEVEVHKWLFVGAYLIVNPRNQTHTDVYNVTFNYAQAIRLTDYDKYINRVVVDWTNKSRQFFYIDKEIINSIELYSVTSKSYFEQDSDFIGYENLSLSYLELKKHWTNKTWKEHLSAVYGVYLITDTKTGKLYVGSAYGSDGVYGRWNAYLKDGYDKAELEDSKYPNVKLRDLVNTEGITYIQEHFKYTLLEIFSKTESGKQQALKREIYYKQVFHSKEFGYNSN